MSVDAGGGIGVDEEAARREARIGVAYGVTAYVWWGLAAVYFKAVGEAGALELLAHRVLWATPMLYGILYYRGRLGVWLATVRDRRTFLTLLGTTLFIATNWLVFIHAIITERLMEASLGYFINPLFSVVLGMVFLKEKLRRWQWVSVALAGVGVSYMTLRLGYLPWISLALAGSFGFYGLVRKTVKAEAMVGLSVETLVMWPAAAGFVLWGMGSGNAAFGTSVRMTLLLMAAGVVTAVPLLCFTGAARRLRLATVGFLQYFAPTGQFLLAVFAYGEAFTRDHAISFSFIWAALLLYSADAFWATRRAYASVGR
jgi:chloramphenicol-sensitive protein RarD